MTAVENARGGYIYLPAGFPFSSGAAAMPGYEVVQAVFRRPIPWRDGFDAMVKLFDTEGRPKQSLCGVELRCPAPMTSCTAPALDTSLSHAAGLIEIAACHA